MQFPTEVFGEVVVVHTPEELGEDVAQELRSYLRAHDRSKFVVDLDGVESIGSAGLEILLDAQDDARSRNGDVKLSTHNSVNRKILEITRLDQQLELFESIIDAVKSFSLT